MLLEKMKRRGKLLKYMLAPMVGKSLHFKRSGDAQALGRLQVDQGRQSTIAALRLVDSHLGAKAKEGLWFNEPVLVGYDDEGKATWNGTSERIIEKSWVLRHIREEPTRTKVLDICCFESLLSLELASNGFRVTGVDLRSFPLQHPNFEFHCLDVCNMPFESEAFDLVIALSAVEHIGLGWYDDPRGKSLDSVAVEEVHRVLKTDGRFLLTVPYGVFGETPLHRIYDIEAIKRLLKYFVITKMEFGVKVDGRTWLAPVPLEQASGMRHDPESFAPSAVALIECEKIDKNG